MVGEGRRERRMVGEGRKVGGKEGGVGVFSPSWNKVWKGLQSL